MKASAFPSKLAEEDRERLAKCSQRGQALPLKEYDLRASHRALFIVFNPLLENQANSFPGLAIDCLNQIAVIYFTIKGIFLVCFHTNQPMNAQTIEKEPLASPKLNNENDRKREGSVLDPSSDVTSRPPNHAKKSKTAPSFEERNDETNELDHLDQEIDQLREADNNTNDEAFANDTSVPFLELKLPTGVSESSKWTYKCKGDGPSNVQKDGIVYKPGRQPQQNDGIRTDTYSTYSSGREYKATVYRRGVIPNNHACQLLGDEYKEHSALRKEFPIFSRLCDRQLANRQPVPGRYYNQMKNNKDGSTKTLGCLYDYNEELKKEYHDKGQRYEGGLKKNFQCFKPCASLGGVGYDIIKKSNSTSCFCLPVYLAIVNGVWSSSSKDTNPLSWRLAVTHDSLYKMQAFLDALTQEYETCGFDKRLVTKSELSGKKCSDYWIVTSKDGKHLLALFCRCHIQVTCNGTEQNKYACLHIDMRPCVLNNGKGTPPGIVPLCRRGISHIYGGDQMELFIQSCVECKCENNNQDNYNDHDGTTLLSNWYRTYGRARQIRNYMLQLWILLVDKRSMEDDPTKADFAFIEDTGVPTTCDFSVQYMMDAWMTIFPEGKSIILGESSFWQHWTTIRQLLGLSKDEHLQTNAERKRQSSHFIVASDKFRYIGWNKEEGVIMSLENKACFSVNPTTKIEQPFFQKTDPAIGLRHHSNLRVIEAPGSLYKLQLAFEQSIPTLPAAYKPTLFGRELQPYTSAVPTWLALKSLPIGSGPEEDGLSYLLKGSHLEHEAYRQAVDDTLEWAKMESIKNHGYIDQQDHDKYEYLVMATYQHGRFNTDITFITLPHLLLSCSYQHYLMEEEKGFATFIKIPLNPNGCVQKYYMNPKDFQGKMVYTRHMSCIIGPATTLQDAGYITHIKGNRQLCLLVIAKPKRSTPPYPGKSTNNSKFICCANCALPPHPLTHIWTNH